MKRLVRILLPLLFMLIFVSARNRIYFPLPHNTSNGTVVGTIIASDPDAGQTLTYKILSGNTSNSFRLNASNGIITVNNATYVNAKRPKTFRLVVQVMDSGGNDKYGRFVRLSARATIIITKQ